MNEIRELMDTELEAVSGGGRHQLYRSYTEQAHTIEQLPCRPLRLSAVTL